MNVETVYLCEDDDELSGRRRGAGPRVGGGSCDWLMWFQFSCYIRWPVEWCELVRAGRSRRGAGGLTRSEVAFKTHSHIHIGVL